MRKNEPLVDEVQNWTDGEKKMCTVVYLDYDWWSWNASHLAKDFFIVKIANLFLAHYTVYGRSVSPPSAPAPPPTRKKLFGSTRFT